MCSIHSPRSGIDADVIKKLKQLLFPNDLRVKLVTGNEVQFVLSVRPLSTTFLLARLSYCSVQESKATLLGQ